MKKFKLAWVSEIEEKEDGLVCKLCNQDISPPELVDGFEALRRLCSGKWDKIAFANQDWIDRFDYVHINKELLQPHRNFGLDSWENAFLPKFLQTTKWFCL